MLIDEPSSSSPTDGDARLTGDAPVASRRALAASTPASAGRGLVAASPLPDRAVPAAASPLPDRAASAAASPRSDEALAYDPTARPDHALAEVPTPRDDHAPADDLRPRDPRLTETAGAPAPEALRAMAVAAAVARELYESGREVRFAFAPSGKRVTVLLCDVDGAVLSRLTPSRALEIATGEPVPGGRRR
jgi:hypothetical protein